MGLGFAQQRAGIIEQHHFLVAQIFMGQAAKARANFYEGSPCWGHQAAQSNALYQVFVVTPLTFPEAGAVV